MSEPAESDSVRPELPRLRIHHLLVLTAVFSLVMSMVLGMWRIARSNDPNIVWPEMSGGISILVITQLIWYAVCISVVTYGFVWRKRGIRFPSQPGHWIAVYISMAWIYESALALVSYSVQVSESYDLWPAISMTASLAFHTLSATLWVFAFRRESIRIWKWGWAAMALRSVLSICLSTYYLVAKGIEWLLEVFWYNHQLNWQPSISRWLGSYTSFLINWAPKLAVLAFLVATVIIDFRQIRQRHWSHWSVVILTFASTLISTGYLIRFYI